jgi:hypothetical protein
MKYHDDDVTNINPDLFPKPLLCLSSWHNDDPNEKVFCNLTRLGQRNDDKFECFAYQKVEQL